MANGFFILKDRSCFIIRWTGYDEIVRIAIKDLYKLEKGKDLADWLSTIVPKEYIHKDENQWRTGFINLEVNEIFVGKELDLRSLTETNQNLFWKALKIGYEKLKSVRKKYSCLNPESLDELLKRSELVNKNDNPLEHSYWSVLANEDFEKLGPWWN